MKGLKLMFGIGMLSAVMMSCSKKDVVEEGDGSASADLNAGGAGQPIPELGTVYFEYDSFNLTSQARGALNANADWLKANSGRNVQIEGHCDERGTEEYNLALGDRRAAAVRDYLIGRGVPASQLSTISYGEQRPAVMGSDESAWSQNRRGVFVSGY